MIQCCFVLLLTLGKIYDDDDDDDDYCIELFTVAKLSCWAVAFATEYRPSIRRQELLAT